MSTASIEQQVIDRITPGTPIEKVEMFISKVMAVDSQLEQKLSASVGANVAMTKYRCLSCGNKNQSLFSGVSSRFNEAK